MQEINRDGMTLIEIVIAIVLLSVGALALAGSSALMVRRLAESSRGTAAAAVAAKHIESSFAKPCSAIAGGNEELFGVSSDWSVSPSVSLTDIRQRVTYGTRRGLHSEEFLTAASCN
jgi:prepilin-type N-terminal cleavage/methylation domain-containing protein